MPVLRGMLRRWILRGLQSRSKRALWALVRRGTALSPSEYPQRDSNPCYRLERAVRLTDW